MTPPRLLRLAEPEKGVLATPFGCGREWFTGRPLSRAAEIGAVIASLSLDPPLRLCPPPVRDSSICSGFVRKSIRGKERMISVINQELRSNIADIVRLFEFRGASAGGNCILRALIGHAPMRACRLKSRLVAVALSYRVGKHRQRDTSGFCQKNNLGGYIDRQLVGYATTNQSAK
jgi:hypothetical protein